MEQNGIFEGLLQNFDEKSLSPPKKPLSLKGLKPKLLARILALLTKFGLSNARIEELKNAWNTNCDLFLSSEQSSYTFSPENVGYGLFADKKDREKGILHITGSSEDEFFVAACHEIGHFLEEQYPEDYASAKGNSETLSMLLELLAIQSLGKAKGQHFLQQRILSFLSDYPAYLFIRKVLHNAKEVTTQGSKTVEDWVQKSVENIFNDTSEGKTLTQKLGKPELVNSIKATTETKIRNIFEEKAPYTPIFDEFPYLPGFLMALDLISANFQPKVLATKYSTLKKRYATRPFPYPTQIKSPNEISQDLSEKLRKFWTKKPIVP